MTDPTPAAALPGSPHLSRALWAAFWMYGGRAGGMVWTLAIVAQLGIADYGKYAMAYAVYSLIGSPLDNVFVVRSVRESEKHFLADRATRYLLGVALMLVGVALLEVNYVAAFGLFVSGGELTLKAWESRPLRDGQPQKAAQIDTARQFASVVPACIYLFVVPDPTLQTATMILVAPYALVALGVGPIALRHKPGMPGSPRVIAILVGETFSIMAGVQGDLLLLGWLTNDTVAGYYGICTTVTLAIVAVGQTFGMSYNQTLREGSGDVSAGPPLKGTVLLGVAAGALVLITGLVMLVLPVVPQELAIAMTIMSLFCGMRTIAMVFQAVLYNQHRDGVRLIANSAIVPVKLALVLLLYGFGAVGAAIASVIGDALLMAIYLRVLYRKTDPGKTVT